MKSMTLCLVAYVLLMCVLFLGGAVTFNGAFAAAIGALAWALMMWVEGAREVPPDDANAEVSRTA